MLTMRNKALSIALILVATDGLVLGPRFTSRRTSREALAGSADQVFCRTPDWNVGAIIPGNEYQHEFVLSSSADASFWKVSISPQCGCSVAGVTSLTMAPGAIERIPVRFIPPIGTGAFSKRIRVAVSNGERSYNFNLLIRGTYAPTSDLHSSSEELDFGDVLVGTTRTTIISIWRGDSKPIEFKGLSPTESWLRLSGSPSVEKSKSYAVLKIPVVFDGKNLAPGRFFREIVVEGIHNGETSARRFRVKANLLPGCPWIKSEVFIRRLKSGVPEILRILDTDPPKGTSLQSLSIRVDDGLILKRAPDVEQGTAVELQFEANCEASVQRVKLLKGEIQLTFLSDDGPISHVVHINALCYPTSNPN
jgi:hypothetical protein